MEFPYFDKWCNDYDFQYVLDCADSYDKTKTMFQAGTNGVVPVDQFDAWCEQRNNYQASTWYLSWGGGGSHPSFYILDKDGYVRIQKSGWNQPYMDAMEPRIRQLLGLP
jgi:hypothetical protein